MSANATKKVDPAGDEPSAESLREMPEIDPENSVSMGRGADGREMAQAYTRAMRGRRRKGEAAPPRSSVHSVRVPDPIWDAVCEFADCRGFSTNAAVNEALAHWIAHHQLRRESR